MQKLITVTINVEKLQAASSGVFTITEVEEINTLLEEGWSIEEWEFLSGDEDSEKAVLLAILNDEMKEPGFDAEMFSAENEPSDDEEEEEEGLDEEDENQQEEVDTKEKESEFSAAS